MDEKSDNGAKQWCLCMTLKLALTICKIFGIFPITWTHKQGRCYFFRSNAWTAYSVILCVLYVTTVGQSTEWLNLVKGAHISDILIKINELLFSSCAIILTVISIFRTTKFTFVLNEFSQYCSIGIPCPTALRRIYKLQQAFMTVALTQLIVQFGALMIINLSNNYESESGYNMWFKRFTQNAPFMSYAAFNAIILVVMGAFKCFELAMLQTLNFSTENPYSTSEIRVLFGLVSFKLCDDDHLICNRLRTLSKAEALEEFRCLHEQITSLLFVANDAFNPQLLIHISVELILIVIRWYSVIIYFTFENPSRYTSTVNLMDWINLSLHMLALFGFLSLSQRLETTINNLVNVIIEFSTRVSTKEEYQQIRLFLFKLSHRRSITANGIFPLNLSIAGPITSNVLTYVLVALQFEVPKK